jgi:hypothetical protein
MNASNRRPFLLSATLGMALALSAFAALQPAMAGDRAQGSRAQRAHHVPTGDYQRHTVRQRTANGHRTDTTLTDAQGRQATRATTVTRNAEARSRTVDTQWTDFEGRTASSRSVTQRTDDGYTTNTSYVNRNGEPGSRSVVATHDAATNTWVKDVTVDRPD